MWDEIRPVTRLTGRWTPCYCAEDVEKKKKKKELTYCGGTTSPDPAPSAALGAAPSLSPAASPSPSPPPSSPQEHKTRSRCLGSPCGR